MLRGFCRPEIEPRFQQQDADPWILRQPGREHRARRSATDDDVVVLAVHNRTRTRSLETGAVDHLPDAMTNGSCGCVVYAGSSVSSSGLAR